MLPTDVPLLPRASSNPQTGQDMASPRPAMTPAWSEGPSTSGDHEAKMKGLPPCPIHAVILSCSPNGISMGCCRRKGRPIQEKLSDSGIQLPRSERDQLTGAERK